MIHHDTPAQGSARLRHHRSTPHQSRRADRPAMIAASSHRARPIKSTFSGVSNTSRSSFMRKAGWVCEHGRTRKGWYGIDAIDMEILSRGLDFGGGGFCPTEFP